MKSKIPAAVKKPFLSILFTLVVVPCTCQGIRRRWFRVSAVRVWRDGQSLSSVTISLGKQGVLHQEQVKR